MELTMTNERVGLIKFAGNDVTVVGPDIMVGQTAPDFVITNQDWAPFHGLQDTQGKVRIIGSLLSLNTSVCDRETRQFNQEAARLGDDVVIMAISMDLPFTIKNWCAAAGIDRVITLSDHKDADFGQKYGLLLKEPRFLRRAIFVVDQNEKVVYAAYMPVLGEEPKYPEVLEAAKQALNK
jgi:thioredoxin-dependent peroxiredoxin